MKLSILILVSITSLTVLTARAQKGGASGGAAVGGGGATVRGAVSTSPSSPDGGHRQVQGGQIISTGPAVQTDVNAQDSNQSNPNASNAKDPNAQNNQPANRNNQPAATNQTTTPRAAGSTPTNSTAATGGQTNAAQQSDSARTADSMKRDQAITPADQTMLVQIRQSVFPPNQPVLPWMSSVHFILKDGAVRLVGTVPTAADRERIETTVQQIPGVVRVYDVISVNASAGAPTGNVSGNAGATFENGSPPANANPSATGNAATKAGTPTVNNPPTFAPTNIGGSVPPSKGLTNIVY